jgi:hypothetical protein
MVEQHSAQFVVSVQGIDDGLQGKARLERT